MLTHLASCGLFAATENICLKKKGVDFEKLHRSFGVAPFATMMTMYNGLPIKTVGKMLGHRNLKTNQHYARILDGKIACDMQGLKL